MLAVCLPVTHFLIYVLTAKGGAEIQTNIADKYTRRGQSTKHRDAIKLRNKIWSTATRNRVDNTEEILDVYKPIKETRST